MKRIAFSREKLTVQITFEGQAQKFGDLPKGSLFAFWGHEDNKLGNVYLKITQTRYHVYGDPDTVFICTSESAPVLKLR